MQIRNLENNSRRIIKKLGYFSVLEYQKDLSVNSGNSIQQYYMSEMGVRRRQLVIGMSGKNTAVKNREHYG